MFFADLPSGNVRAEQSPIFEPSNHGTVTRYRYADVVPCSIHVSVTGNALVTSLLEVTCNISEAHTSTGIAGTRVCPKCATRTFRKFTTKTKSAQNWKKLNIGKAEYFWKSERTKPKEKRLISIKVDLPRFHVFILSYSISLAGNWNFAWQKSIEISLQ